MNAYHNIPLRTARNSLLATVSAPDTVLAFPIRDLLVCYPQNPLFNQKIKIYILGAETDVDYFLLDEKGKTIPDRMGKRLEIGSDEYKAFLNGFKKSMELERLKGSAAPEDLEKLNTQKADMEAGGQLWLKMFPEGAVNAATLADDAGAEQFILSLKSMVVLSTPNITRDASFSILAQKALTAQEQIMGRSREANLVPGINLRPNIQVTLTIKTIHEPDAETLVDINAPNAIIDPFDDVQVDIASKKDMIWHVENADTLEILLNNEDFQFADEEAKPDTKTGVIRDIRNDVVLDVKSYRKGVDIDQNDPSNQFLLRRLPVLVRPDRGINFDFAPGATLPLPFDTVPGLQIEEPQKNAGYQLFRYRLTKPLLSIEGTVEEPALPDLDAALAAGTLTPVYFFKSDTPATPDVSTNDTGHPLKEDSVLVIRVDKSNVGENAWLSKRLAVRPLPDPGRRLQVDPPFSTPGEAVHIRLPDAEAGVGYQLIDAGTQSNAGPLVLTGANHIGWESNGRKFGMRVAEDAATAGRTSDFRVRNAADDIPALPITPVELTLGPVTPASETEYTVQAVKEITGEAVMLTQPVTARQGFIQFNGSSDRITAAGYKGIAGTQARTTEAWIRANQAGPVLAWGLAGTAGARWLLQVNANGIFELDIQGAQLAGKKSLLDGAWHHVCCVLEPPDTPGQVTLKNVRLYVDGALEQTEITGNDIIINTGSSDAATDLIAGNDGATAFFEGDMAEIRVWEEAIAEADLQNTMYQRLAGTEPGLALYWKFNDNNLADSSV